MDMLFGKNYHELRELNIPDIYDTCEIKEEKKFDILLNKIKSIVNASYEDVEDMGDIIMLLNEAMLKIIVNKNYTNKQVRDLLLTRLLAKKSLNKKYRDSKNGRIYFNSIEAERQYMEHVLYVWKPSVTEIISLANKHNRNKDLI